MTIKLVDIPHTSSSMDHISLTNEGYRVLHKPNGIIVVCGSYWRKKKGQRPERSGVERRVANCNPNLIPSENPLFPVPVDVGN